MFYTDNQLVNTLHSGIGIDGISIHSPAASRPQSPTVYQSNSVSASQLTSAYHHSQVSSQSAQVPIQRATSVIIGQDEYDISLLDADAVEIVPRVPVKTASGVVIGGAIIYPTYNRKGRA